MPTLPCQALLNERSAEIIGYLRFIKKIISDNATLFNPATNNQIPISKDLTHTLKANGYLLLYNVVEATMTTAIEDIHAAIERDWASNSDITLDRMNPKLFERVLSRFRAGKSSDLSAAAPVAGRWLIKYWLDDHAKLVKENKNPLASGNLDGRKILEMAEIYGFDSFGRVSAMKHKGMHMAKQKRNDLAHGKTSFLDCGKDIGLEDLISDSVGVLRCLRHHVQAIQIFISERGYLFQALPPAPTSQATLGQLLQPA